MKKFYTTVLIILIIIGNIKSQDFYDINNINTIEITFEESNWDYLLDELVSDGQEERLMGSLTINGVAYDSVGVRYKGNSSYNSDQIKNPLNIKLDYIINDQKIEGYGTLKLANVFKDPSFVRETMSYEIARKYIPAGLSNYTNVYVNGTHLGLYTNNQDVDKYFMRTHFSSDENIRFKGEISSPGPGMGVWKYFGSDSSSYYNLYANESDYGWDELVDFIDTMNNHENDIDKVLNIDRHLWFLAFSNLIVNLDGPINMPQNYYLYKDDTGRMNPILWDLNISFGVFNRIMGSNDLTTIQLQELSPFFNISNSDNPIISNVLSNSSYRKMYVAHMKTILEENFENDLYETRALEIQDIIADDVSADNNKFYTYSDFTNNVYNSVDGEIGIVELMDARITYINSLLDFQYTAPNISNVSFAPEEVLSGTDVWITAEVSSNDDVYLAYRTNKNSVFNKIEMFDDGNHEDGAANDDVYGIDLTAGYFDIQCYIYAENDDAVAFFPVRAEYEFLNIEITVEAGDIVINEFMADNENTVADQDGEYDDWIELYNNSDEDINLAGCYLTDDENELDQWIFPDATISAGGYLIVWADNDEEQDGLHANFKLSSSGETIVLSGSDFSLMDIIEFSQQKPDVSYGRYPNGIGNFMEMVPTFSAENTNQTIGVEEVQIAENGFILKQNKPNPFKNNTTINFTTNEENYVRLSVHNLNGNIIKTIHSGRLLGGEYSFSFNASTMAKGVYFYSLTVGGKAQYKKMIIQ